MTEDKSARYHRLQRIAGIASLVWTLLLFVLLVATGASVSLRAAAESIASGLAPSAIQPVLVVALYVVFLTLVNEAGALVFAFYSGFIVEKRYGLSNQTLGGWTIDQLKALAVGTILGILAANVIYFFIRRSPDGWWLPAGAIFAILIIGLANLGPVVFLPIFYTVKPLGREALRLRLMALADRAEARVLGAYEWGLAAKTKKANAALAGLGGTRRILVSDTMLAEYSDDEIEVVLAHELAHHVHGDIWKGLIFESGLLVVGFLAAARLLRAFVAATGLRGPADVAGLPLLLLAAGTVSIVMLPIAHALSRRNERSADRFALEMTRNPAAFTSAMRRLAAQNLAEEDPSRLVQWLFYSHPPIRERIAAAQVFATNRSG